MRIASLESLDREPACGAACKSFGCGAAWSRIAVDVDGGIHGCSKLAFGARTFQLGDVFEGIGETVNRQRLMNHTLRGRVKCSQCSIRDRCGGGCYAANIIGGGGVYEPTASYCGLMFTLDRFRQELEHE